MRVEAASVMQFMVDQRLVAPFHCVPPLVALGCDSHENTREIAHKLLATIYEKHPEFVGGKSSEGIRTAYDFLQRSSQPPSLKYWESEGGVRRLYKIIQSNRQRRATFVDGLFGKINKFVAGSCSSDTNFPVFLVEQLGTLPYIFRDEPLLVIYKASELLSLYTEAKVTALRRFVKPEDYQDSSELDLIEAVTCSHQMGILGMLIVLKAYLKHVHCLSDAMCETFAPSNRDTKDKDKPLPLWSEERPPEVRNTNDVD